MPPSSDDEPRVYTVVLTEPAEAEIDDAYVAMKAVLGPESAFTWRESIHQSILSLELFPQMCAISERESRAYRREVRTLLHGRGRSCYKVLFTLIDADGDGTDDTVRILHVRHASRE
jgi:plasmid stabilization system protein ParE